jgi:hypothetical protein
LNYKEERVCSVDNLEFALEQLWRNKKDLRIVRKISSVFTLINGEILTTYHFNATIQIEDTFLNHKYPPLLLQCSFLSPGNTQIKKPFIEFDNMKYFLDQLEDWFGHELIYKLFGEKGIIYHPRVEDSLLDMKLIKVRTWPSVRNQ